MSTFVNQSGKNLIITCGKLCVPRGDLIIGSSAAANATISSNGTQDCCGLSVGQTYTQYGGWDKQIHVHGNRHSHVQATTNCSAIKMGIFAHCNWGGAVIGAVGTNSNHIVSMIVNNTHVGCWTSSCLYHVGAVKTPILCATSYSRAPYYCVNGQSDIRPFSGDGVRGIQIRSGCTNGVAALEFADNAGTWRGTLYTTTDHYGFLDSSWGSWDIKKAVNGSMCVTVGSSGFLCVLEGGICSAAKICSISDICSGNAVYLSEWVRFNCHTRGLYWAGACQLHVYPAVGNCPRLYIRSCIGNSSIAMTTCNNTTPRGYIYADCNSNMGFLDASHNWSIRHYHGNCTEFRISNAIQAVLRTNCFCHCHTISAHHCLYSGDNICAAGCVSAPTVLANGGNLTSFLQGCCNYRTFRVCGDADTFYPVCYHRGSGWGYKRYSINRSYNSHAPNTWYSSTHKGGLNYTWEQTTDTQWGGNDRSFRVNQIRETYTTVMGGHTHTVSGGIVWLRGGGADYCFFSDSFCTSCVCVYDGVGGTDAYGMGHSSCTYFCPGNCACACALTCANAQTCRNNTVCSTTAFPIQMQGTGNSSAALGCFCQINLTGNVNASGNVCGAVLCATTAVRGTEICSTNWLRNTTCANGIYNQSTCAHFYSAGANYWHINGTCTATSGGLVFYKAYNGSHGNLTNRRGYVYWDGTGNFGLLSCAGNWGIRIEADTNICLGKRTFVCTCVCSPIVCATTCAKAFRGAFGGADHTCEQNESPIRLANNCTIHQYISSCASSWGSWSQWVRYVGACNTWRIGAYDAACQSGIRLWRLGARNQSAGEINYIVAGPQLQSGTSRVALYCPYARDSVTWNGDGNHYPIGAGGIICGTSCLRTDGHLCLTANTPYICTGGAYIIVPGGIYVNGGTFYAENTTMHRNGICDDTASILDIWGGNNSHKCTNLRGKTFVCQCLYVHCNICLAPDTSGDMQNGISLGKTNALPQASWGETGTKTGRIEIGLPTLTGEGGSNHYGMVHVAIDVYEYNSNDATTIIVGGHNWQCRWYNCGAHITGGCTNKTIKVAYHTCGGSGCNGRYMILLGECDSTWTYGSVHVRSITNGLYYCSAMDLGTPWYVKRVTCADSHYNQTSGDLRTASNSMAGYQCAMVCFHGPRVCATTCVEAGYLRSTGNICATSQIGGGRICSTATGSCAIVSAGGICVTADWYRIAGSGGLYFSSYTAGIHGGGTGVVCAYNNGSFCSNATSGWGLRSAGCILAGSCMQANCNVCAGCCVKASGSICGCCIFSSGARVMSYGTHYASSTDWDTIFNTAGQYGQVMHEIHNGTSWANSPGSSVYSYGGLLNWHGNGMKFQMYLPHTGSNGQGLYYRTNWSTNSWYGWARIWDSNNDGASSGLDADLLDGQHGSYYRNASNLNAGTVATARLGSGTASSSTYLRGDGTWAAVSGGSSLCGCTTSSVTQLGVGAIASATGSSNTAVGVCSMNAGGGQYSSYNTAIGERSLCKNVASSNTAVGFRAGECVCSGSAANNVYVGSVAGYCAKNGARNTFVGKESGGTSNYGCDNIAIGYLAKTGSFGCRNVIIAPEGCSAQCLGNSCNNIVIGYMAAHQHYSYSNCTFIGNSAMCKMYLCAGTVCVCGSLSKSSGCFSIPHPDPAKTERYNLSHSFVESPTEGDNIYRYTVDTQDCRSVVELPDYYRYLNKNDQVWVSANRHFGVGYGEVTQDQKCLVICSCVEGSYNVLLIGTRKDKHVSKWKGTETIAHDRIREAELEAKYGK